MQLRQLQYFVALARERHFARAAEVTYVSQPALSEAIRKLEQELQVPLVNRGHSFQGLTPEGERLVLWARRILADHEALQQEVAAMRSGLDGCLRLGVIPAASTTSAWLVEAFCSAHPLVTVDLLTRLSTDEILLRLQRFELDAGIVHTNGPCPPELEITPLYLAEQVLIVGGDVLPEDVDHLTWSELEQLPLCALNRSMRERQLIDDLLEPHGIALRPRVETDSIASIFALANSGHWVGVVPRPWLGAFPLGSGVRVLSITEPKAATEIGVVVGGGKPGSLLGRALVDVARTAASARMPM